ncbi:MAG TPA: CoA pyrophosphatase [Candidatus Limnocylindrales bacterium]|jgi:8-oxo-dGTP pyrophosphatase MutT (NUDIX family)
MSTASGPGLAFAEIVDRLGRIPVRLPPPPVALVPVRLDGETWTAPIDGPASARPAAVLVLLAPDATGRARVVLIERTSYEGHHSAEISLPGGSAEAGDADLAATALREAAEEVGLDPAEIGLRVVGELERFWIPVSNFLVTPVVAVADRLPAWRPDPREVARVIEAPLDAFLPGAPISTFERDIRGWRIRYGAYQLAEVAGGPAVWGATARILGQLGAILAG